jgi:hypothetical protein
MTTNWPVAALASHGFKQATSSSWVEQGLKKYEEQVARTEQHLLQKLARKYNLVLQPKAA